MTMLALPVHIALVDETGTIPLAELQRVAGALNEQVARDFGPIWHVRASVGAYTEAPPFTWAIRIRAKLDEPGVLGYHTDENHQPGSYVMLVKDWPSVCSHELLEMLADPWGARFHSGRLPLGFTASHAEVGLKHPTSQVRYLLEVCDPPEATSYDIGGVAVSDFIRPDWYHANVRVHDAYSFAGGCRAPRQVAEGGYVSFAVGNHWYQVFSFGGPPTLHDLGVFDANQFPTIRQWTDQMAQEFRAGRSLR